MTVVIILTVVLALAVLMVVRIKNFNYENTTFHGPVRAMFTVVRGV